MKEEPGEQVPGSPAVVTGDAHEMEVAAPGRSPRSVLLANPGEPIRLAGVYFSGVSAEAARPADKAKVWTRLALTSDDPMFHRVVENLGSAITQLAQKAGATVNLGRANTVLLVIHPDNTAELWVDAAAVALRSW